MCSVCDAIIISVSVNKPFSSYIIRRHHKKVRSAGPPSAEESEKQSDELKSYEFLDVNL